MFRSISMPEQRTQRCCGCKIHRSFDDFYKHRNKPNGLQPYCKSCWNTRSHARKDKENEYRLRVARGQNPKRQAYLFNYMLKKNYGITAQDFDQMRHAQKDLCAICQRHSSVCSRGLMVDHDHATGKVRALLCLDCNTGIGKLREDTSILARAIDYIEGHGSVAPLYLVKP